MWPLYFASLDTPTLSQWTLSPADISQQKPFFPEVVLLGFHSVTVKTEITNRETSYGGVSFLFLVICVVLYFLKLV